MPDHEPFGVAILGSCVSRDAFEFADPADFKVELYLARTGLASLLGRKSESFRPDFDRIASSFQRRMVMNDVHKTGRNQLRAAQSDVFVYDPIDERFSLAIFEDRGIATVSTEFTRLETPTSEYSTVKPWSEEHFSRWLAGWGTFLRLLDESGVGDRLVIHNARWVDRVKGSAEPSASLTAIETANEWLSRAQMVVRESVPDDRIITVSPQFYEVDPNHRWGISPFHYVQGYYEDFLAQLKEIARHLGHRESSDGTSQR